MNLSINELISYKAVYRTAPATPGLLKMEKGAKQYTHSYVHGQF